jgi:hypothetical protein
MTHHRGSLEIDRPISESEAIQFGVPRKSLETPAVGTAGSPTAEIAPRQ